MEKLENTLNYCINKIIEEKFSDECEKETTFDKILCCFSDECLETKYSKLSLNRLDIQHIKNLIEYDCKNLQHRINFVSEIMFNNYDIDYTFLSLYSKKFIFDELKKRSDESNDCYNSVKKLKKNLLIKHIQSLSEFIDEYTMKYIEMKTNTENENTLSFENLNILNISDLDLINNSLLQKYLLYIEQFGDDLDLTLKVQKDFENKQRLIFFK